MIHIWLITRKDFLFARLRLATWYSVLAAKTLLGLWLMHGGAAGTDVLAALQPAGLALLTAEAALAYLITALIVQEDSPDGETFFWRTRPIAGWRLLLAKLTSVSLLLVLPVPLIALPLWLSAGAGPSDVLDSAILQVLMQVLIVVPAYAMAVFTRRMSGFVFGTLVGYVVLPVLLGMATGELLTGARSAPRLIVGLHVGAIGGCVLAGLHYLTPRRVLRWLAAVAAAGATFVYLGLRSTQPAVQADPEASYYRSLATARLQIEFDTMRPTVRQGPLRSEEDLRPLLRVTGVPAEFAVRVWADEQQLRWTDTLETSRSDEWSPLSLGLELRAVRTALGLRPTGLEQGVLPLTLSFPVKSGVAARMVSDPPIYSLSARLAVLRPDVSLVQPLDAPGWQAVRGQGLRILSAHGGGQDGLRIIALNCELLVRSRVLRGDAALADPREGLVSPVLIPRTRERMIDLTHREDGMMMLAGLRFTTSTLRAVDMPDVRGRAADFSLVWSIWEEVATVRRHVHVNRPTVEVLR